MNTQQSTPAHTYDAGLLHGLLDSLKRLKDSPITKGDHSLNTSNLCRAAEELASKITEAAEFGEEELKRGLAGGVKTYFNRIREMAFLISSLVTIAGDRIDEYAPVEGDIFFHYQELTKGQC